VHWVVQCLSGLFLWMPRPVLLTCSINAGSLWPWPRIDRSLGGNAYLDAHISNRCRNILNHKPTCNICCVHNGRLVVVLVEWSISLDLYTLGTLRRQDDSGPMILLIRSMLNDQIEDSTISDPHSRSFFSSAPKIKFHSWSFMPEWYLSTLSARILRFSIPTLDCIAPSQYLPQRLGGRLQADTLTRTRLYLPVHVARGERIKYSYTWMVAGTSFPDY